MIIPEGMWIIVLVSLLCCIMGFKQFVWFMSIGYGMSAAGIGATMLVMMLVRGQFSVLFLIQCVLFIVYGIRLGGFLLVRQLKNKAYQAKMAEVGGEMTVPIFVAVAMWICCGILYVMQSASPVYRLLNGAVASTNVWMYVGVAISAIGIVIEALADQQKGEAKKKNPNMPAMDGLYKMCRCPNYFGEILFWTGAFLSGIGALSVGQWIISVLGYVCIVGIMVSGAKRVEGRHIRHYGKKPEYEKYANSVPLLFPLIPLYHMTSEDQLAKEEAAKKAKAEAKKAGKKA